MDERGREQREFDVLVAGDAVPDVIVGDVPGEIAFGQTETLVERGTLTVGGSSAITACGLARLGLRVAFVGVIGGDDAGRFMLDALETRSIDVSACVVLPGRTTGLTVHLVRPGLERDRAMLTASGCVGELTTAMLPRRLLRRARHLHVGSFYLLPRLAPDLATLFDEAGGEGMGTSVDTQGDWADEWRGGIDEVLTQSDLFFANQEEARAIARSLGLLRGPNDMSGAGRKDVGAPGRWDVDAAGRNDVGAGGRKDMGPTGSQLEPLLRAFVQHGTRPVVKRGADGAAALDGDTFVSVPALPMDPVDTIGAGDTFDAGYLAGHLLGWPVRQSLAFAAACGSLSTRAAGGVEAQPSMQEALERAGDEGGR